MVDGNLSRLNDDELEAFIRTHMHAEFTRVPYEALDRADERMLEDADRVLPNEDEFDGDEIEVPLAE